MVTRILVPLDRSGVAEEALPTAAAIAKAASAELRLVLVHEPIPFDGFADAVWNASEMPNERAYLERQAREIECRFGIHVIVEHRVGEAAETIAAIATAHGSDLIVMTTHGRTGLKREWLGSVADTIMRSLDVPVLMLRPVHGKVRARSGLRTFRRILIPLDGSPRAESIIDAAMSIGGPRAIYHLTRVVAPVPVVLDTAEPLVMAPMAMSSGATELLTRAAEPYLYGIADRMRAKGATAVEHEVVTSALVAHALLDIAKKHQVDMIAIATHGRGASRLLLGSVADKLVRGGATALLVSRGPHA